MRGEKVRLVGLEELMYPSLQGGVREVFGKEVQVPRQDGRAKVRRRIRIYMEEKSRDQEKLSTKLLSERTKVNPPV